MKAFMKFTVFFLLLSCGGTYSKFRLTGTPYNPLPDNKDIKIVQSGSSDSFEEIGIAKIKNPDEDARISEAKRLARQNGGEVIMPVTMDDDSESNDTEEFRVLMPIEAEEPEVTIIPEPPPPPPIAEKPPVKIAKEKPDYRDLPVVPYNILVGEFANLTGEKFRDSMYPVKFVKVPKDLKAEKNSRIIQMETKKGGSSAYLLIRQDMVNKFQEIIKSGKKIQFAYSPFVLYKGRVPVLKLIDVIG